MTYRDDIDGLRAVAVLLIVFFHAHLANVPGGFVGVDVFFVISGYLITNLIMRDIAADRFSYRNFYMRRLRRLGPALFVTLIITLLVGWFILPPELYQNAGQSALATIFSVSNIYFWLQTGYFDTASIHKPFLHTWSLAVEEQFYLIWPTLLVLGARFLSKHGILIGVVLLSAISLIFGELLLDRLTSTSFFLTPFRMFEFGAGALLALSSWQARNVVTANAASFGGLMIIFYVASTYDELMRFPGINAAIPAAAAALMIYGGPTAVMNRALAVPPIRYIGQISYSVYLVHWPLFIYYAYLYGHAETSLEIIGLVCTTLTLGAVMYHLVETPFRLKKDAKFKVPTAWLAWGSLVTATAICLVSWQIHRERGYASRFAPEIITLMNERRLALDQRLTATREWDCNASDDSEGIYFEEFEGCLPETQENMIVVLGDSHAADVFMGLNGAYPDKPIVQLTGNGCNIAKRLDGSTFCAPFLRHWTAWMTENAANIDAVIYAQSARSLMDRGPEGSDQPSLPYLRLVDQNLAAFHPEGVPFFFWGPRPEFRPTIDIAIARSRDREHLRNYYIDAQFDGEFALDAWLKRYAEQRALHYISTLDTLCATHCPSMTDDDALFVTDYAHWTPEGAAVAVRKMIAANDRLAAIFAN